MATPDVIDPGDAGVSHSPPETSREVLSLNLTKKTIVDSPFEFSIMPKSSLERKHLILIATCSIVQFITGMVVSCSAIYIHVYFKRYSYSHTLPPALWWTGVPPVVLSVFGLRAFRYQHRKQVFRWGLASLVVTVGQLSLMGAVKNFSLALYDVWPLYNTYRGYPLCQIMVDRCYCIDEFHGSYSLIEMGHVQYIHQDVRWKETGFFTCEDVTLVSQVYFSIMGCLAVYSVASVAGFVCAMVCTVCQNQGAEFSRLDDAWDLHEEDELVNNNTDKMYRELQVLSNKSKLTFDNGPS